MMTSPTAETTVEMPVARCVTDVEETLRSADLDIIGRVAHASNATLVCDASTTDTALRCVYKPIRGEAPLWDFPDGTLAGREVASYLISAALGWDLVPPTILRSDAPLGPGMVQEWITESDEPDTAMVDLCPIDEVPPGAKAILAAYDGAGREVVLIHADDDRLRRLAVLDVILNNADRKGGHILSGCDGRLYGIDHGLCLHTEPKLRTVLWGWAGEQVPASVRSQVAAFAAELDDPHAPIRAQLREHITAAELNSLRARCRRLADTGAMPPPPEHRPIPWPPF